MVLGGSMNSFGLHAEQTLMKTENLTPMPSAIFLEYLGSAIEIDGSSNIIEPMELNALDTLGLLASLNKKTETKQDLETMKKSVLKSSIQSEENK